MVDPFAMDARDGIHHPPPQGPIDLAPTANSAPGRRRLLVVEDDHDAAELLREVLESFGHEVVVANDGEGALAELAHARPDAIVCDLQLGGPLDGLGVARRVRATPGCAKVRMVALTGSSADEVHRAARLAGFDDHLVKPVPLAVLEAAIA